MNPRTVASLCCLVLVVLAGCNGGTGAGSRTADQSATPTTAETAVSATTTPTATGTTQDTYGDVWQYGNVTVTGQDLPFDPGVVYRRVQNLSGLVGEEVTITVKEEPNSGMANALNAREHSFASVLNLTPPESGEGDGGVGIAGYTRGSTIYLYTYGNATTRAETMEQTLAHEFVHALQFDHGLFMPAYRNATGSRLAGSALSEGAAVYVERHYDARHLNDSYDPSKSRFAGRWASYEPYEQYGIARYYYGQRYVRAVIDDPAAIESVYDDAPTTMEQLIHPTVSEGQQPLTVTLSGSEWNAIDPDGPPTKGEHVVRIVLHDELNQSTVDRAATGWGNDQVVVARTTGTDRRGYTWALRWDTERDADEFQTAFESYLSERGTATDAGWEADGNQFRVLRPTGDVVVVVAGPSDFVTNATATAAGADVSVTVNATATVETTVA